MERKNGCNMKCLFDLSFIRHNIYAGVSKYAYRILDYIVEVDKSHEFVLLLNTISERQIREWYPEFEYKLIGSGYLTSVPVVRTLALTYQFKRIVDGTDCDVVFCPWGNEITCLRTNKRKISVIHDLQLRIDLKGAGLYIHKIIDDLVIKNSDKIVTISEFSKKQIFSFYPSLSDDFIVSLGNSVSANQYLGENLVDGRYLLYVGRICEMKNVVTLVKAYVRISNLIKGVRLIIVGKSNTYWYKQVEPIIKAANLSESIQVVENCSERELALLYRYADIFVFPSLREGFGSPPLEAAMECTPVISTTCDSLKEVLLDKVFTYDNPMDEEELSEKILFVLSHRPSDRELAEIRNTYLNHYSIGTFGKKVYDFIQTQSNQ
mgnify:FL=1